MVDIITEGASGNKSTGVLSSLSLEHLNSFIHPYRSKGPIQPEEGLQGKPWQIIVKLANIHLTPQKLEYKGGKWHVENKMVSPYNLHIYI